MAMSEKRMTDDVSKTKDKWDVYFWIVHRLRIAGFSGEQIERMVITPDVPRGTCSTCGQAIPSQKVKHKEVFENVIWNRNETVNIVFPYFDINPSEFEKFMRKNTKVIVEWEE